MIRSASGGMHGSVWPVAALATGLFLLGLSVASADDGTGQDARPAADTPQSTPSAMAGGNGAFDDLLSPETWDSARVIAAIRASDLPQARKDDLVERVRSVGDSEDPDLRASVVEEIRAALTAG